MNPETEWEMARVSRESRFGEAGMGALRVALLFGSAAVALALLVTPFAESHTRSRISRATFPPGLDFTSTGTIAPGGNYTIRRSVLQASPEAVCVIRDSGARSGNC